MKTQEAYTEWSKTYDSDRNLTRDLDQQVTEALLGRLRCRSVLEIGCGTGKNTSLLSRIGERVLALDFSPGMMARAREKPQLANVSFIVADVTQPWPCTDQFADLIACNLVLEHIEDISFTFREAGRALVEGGRLFVCEFHPYQQYLGTKAHFQRAGTTIGIPALVHHISDFTGAALTCGLSLRSLQEWWHEADKDKPPRLVSFMFEKIVQPKHEE